MTPRMPRDDRYSYDKLDSDGNWIYDMPTSVAATGQWLDQPHPTPPTAPAPPMTTIAPPQRRNDQYIYPDPTNASRRPVHPYSKQRRQNFGAERASRSPPRDLNPKALSFFAPVKRASETLRRETEHKRRASCQREEVPRVVADNSKIRPSSAARRASRSATAFHAGRTSAHQHPDRRLAAPSNVSQRTLQEQVNRSPLPAQAQPVSVPEWTADQTNAYHPGVGQVRARLPQQPDQRRGIPMRGTSSELLAWGIEERFPCRIEVCKSKHEPYMHQGQLTKHMIAHQPNDTGRRHKCDQCGRCFRYPRELERHLPTHESIVDPKDQFSCSRCSASFGRKDNFQRHVRQKHPEPSTRFGLFTPPRTVASSSRFDPRDFPPLPPPPPTPPRSVDR